MSMTEKLDDYIAAYGDEFDYAFDNNIMLNWYPKRIMSLTHSDNKVLELGIGHGHTCNHFSDYYATYSVIDGSKSVIEQFKLQYPQSKAEIIESYFETFRTNETYDVIIMGFVLEHVDNPAQILNHFKQFIAPNGRCFVSVPNAESLHRRFGHEAGLLGDMSTLSAGDHALGHQRLYTVESMTQQLQECGYEVINQEGIFLKPLTTGQLKSLALSQEILDGMCKVGIHYPELSAGLLFEAKMTA
jgi:2-polyprenyl-3-methyl-5-hydroxy-6-metoxy-1,4-benzoquinol methylase